MNLLQKLLLVIASAGLMIFAPAGGITHGMGLDSPTDKQQADFHSSSSFADIFNFMAGTKYQTVPAGVVNHASDGAMGGLTRVTNLTLTQHAGSGMTGPVPGEVSSSKVSLIDRSQVRVAGDYSGRIAGIADGQVGGGNLVAVATEPEPAGWMLLLCGLTVVGFIARRKTDLVSG